MRVGDIFLPVTLARRIIPKVNVICGTMPERDYKISGRKRVREKEIWREVVIEFWKKRKPSTRGRYRLGHVRRGIIGVNKGILRG